MTGSVDGPSPAVVLVPGAWHGAWAWRLVEAELASEMCTMSVGLTGVGERAHLLTPDVGLQTHVDDVVQAVQFLDAVEVVLVGHSYAGFVVHQAAEELRTRVVQVVLLDGWAGLDGESLLTRAPDWFGRWLAEGVEESGAGWLLPPPSADLLGIEDPILARVVQERLTPHPWKSFTDPLVLKEAEPSVPTTQICTRPGIGLPFAELAAEFGWPVVEIDGGHDAMLTNPTGTAEAIRQAVLAGRC